MRIGNMVQGKKREVNEHIKYYISGSNSRDSLLAHKLNLIKKNKKVSTKKDTIELWSPEDIRGMIVKIDSDISGYGFKLAQVLLERRIVWFLVEDLELVPKPAKQENFPVA